MMNRILYIFIALSSYCYGMMQTQIDPTALQQLTAELNIPNDADLVEVTQKQWLRKPGQERWEMSEVSAEKRQFILNWAQKVGLFSEWTPSFSKYDQALVLGATTSCMQKRFNYLKALWISGTRFDQIVWLTGDRPLDPRVDGLTDQCKTESDAAIYIHQNTELPQEMRALPVRFVAVPMKGTAPNLQRPNTKDTLIAWIDQTPSPCTALFISDQPFCGYQFAIVRGCVPFPCDMAGPKVEDLSHPAAAAIILDTVARWIYQNHLNEKQ